MTSLIHWTRAIDIFGGIFVALGTYFALTGTWFFGVPLIAASLYMWAASIRLRRRLSHRLSRSSERT